MTDWRDDFGARVLDRPTGDLSGVSDDPVCHRFNGVTAAQAACGVPRSEQPDHGEITPTFVVRGQTHCPWCGNPVCPRCRGAM